MHVKQYTVKVCEFIITDDNECINFFNKNYDLFKDHLIVINGQLSEDVKKYLHKKELKFVNNVELPKKKEHKQKTIKETKQEIIPTEEKPTDIEQNQLTVLDTLVRSGREINIDGDLLLLNRVNSGATIETKGNLIITQIVEGSIRCNGSFMMLKASPKAVIVFQGVEVDNTFLSERLNRVDLINNEIVITPVLKETNWAS